MENTAVKKDRRRKVSSLAVANYALLTLIAVICIVPFFNVISKSFSTYGKTILLLPKGRTFYNYKQVFSTFAFFRAFFVSVGVTITGTILSVAVMFMAAYPLSKKDLPFRGAIMVFFTIVMLFSGGIIPNFFVVKTLGLLNTPFALVLPSVVQVYNMILLKSGLEAIPAEIEESARIDGAGNGRILASILLPISVPSIASVGLFTAVSYWNNYFQALIYLINAEKYYPLALYILNRINTAPDILGDQKLYQQKEFIDSAMIILSILPIVCVYPFVLKFFVRGLTVGSVKG